MGKAILGAAEIVGGAILEFVPGGQAIGTMLLLSGIATEASAIAQALGSNQGIGVTTRSAAALRQIIRGEQRVGGVIVYCSTTGGSDELYNMVIAAASHEIDAFENLYLDGRRVIWNPTTAGCVACGAVDTPATVTLALSGGAVSGLTLVSGSSGYWANYPGGGYGSTVIPARVRILGDGKGARATATIQGGTVISVTLTAGGEGYTWAQCIVDGAFIFGGRADPSNFTGPNGQQYTFGSEVEAWPYFGDQDATTGFCSTLHDIDSAWAATADGTPYLGGCAYFYLKLKYDQGTFPQFPEIRTTIRGKNDIYDPRTGLTGYTSNWALHIADAIADPTWGLGDGPVSSWPADSITQLIAAANVCDEQVLCQAPTIVDGLVQRGTQYESRYSLHWHYDTGTSPGDAIQQMMDAADGRLSRIGGGWYIWPAYWQGPSFTFSDDALIDKPQWNPKRALADLCNRVTGTFIAPNFPYNIAGDLYDSNGFFEGLAQDNFPYAFQPTSYPMYACDQLHGYGTGVDVYLTEDGGIFLPLEVPQPCILSVAQAQRVAKIKLLRNRQQGSGIFPMKLAAWAMQPTDVMQFSMSSLGWLNKVLEVVSVKFKTEKLQGQDTPASYVELGVQETDPSVYEFELEEELNVYDVPVFSYGAPSVVPPPTAVSVEDDSLTAVVASDGTLVPRMLVSWTPPVDTGVNNGGKIEAQVQYSFPLGTTGLPWATTTVGSTLLSPWLDAGAFSGQSTYCYIPDISSSTGATVQVRSLRANGAVSVWVQGYRLITGLPRPRALTSSATQVSGTTANPAVASAFADLPELGAGDAPMSVPTHGNPCLLGVSLAFAALGGGGSGAVTSLGTTFGTAIGSTPPSISISISGDGSGAGASLSWANVGGSGSSTEWEPTLTLSGGANYTTATATVRISPFLGTGYSSGTYFYSCGVAAGTPVSGLPIQVQVLMDGGAVLGPLTLVTNSAGVASYSATELLLPAPAAGTHVFQVQAMTSSSTAIDSTGRSFQLIELS